MPTPETVLYELQVKPNFTAAESAVGSLGTKLDAVGKNSKIKLDADASGLSSALVTAEGKIKGLGASAAAAGKGLGDALGKAPIPTGLIEGLEAKLQSLTNQKRKALSVEEAAAFSKEIQHTQHEIEKLNEDIGKTSGQSSVFGKLKSSLGGGAEGGGGGGIGGAIVGGAIGAGAATAAIEGFKFLAEKAGEAHAATEQVATALGKAGFAGESAKKELDRISEASAKIGDDFALPANEVKQLQGTIVGFSGLTGAALDHLTEISIGSSKALGLSAEGVARLIAKSSDPESVATLKRIGVQFDANATAAEKMATIEKKLGPAIQAAKDANNDAFGSFEKVKNKLTETVVTLGSKLFEALGPAITALSDAIGAILPIIDPVITVLSFLLKVGIELTLFPLNAAKAFIHWAGSLGPVKDAIAAVGKVISDVKNFIGGLIDTVKNAGSALLSLIGITDKETESSKKTSAALKEKAAAETKAAEAAQKNEEAIQGSITAMEAEQTALKGNVDEARKRYLLNKQIAEDPTRDEATRKQAEQYLKDNANFAAAAQKKLDHQKKNSEEFDKLAGITAKTKKAAGKSEFQREMELLDNRNKERELASISFERKILDRVRDEVFAGTRKTAELTKEEEQKIAEKKQEVRIRAALDLQDKLANIDAAGNITGLKVGSKKGDETKDLTTVKSKLVTLQSEIAKEGLNILKLDVAMDMQNIHKSEDELFKMLTDLQIGNIRDEKARETAALKEKQEQELSYINALKRTGAQLTTAELSIERELHIKHERELLDLKKKYAEKANEDGAKIVTAGLDAIFAQQKKLTAAELRDKVAGFDSQQTALQSSYSRGEVSAREFNTRLQALNQQRTDFESANSNSVAEVATRAYKAMGGAAIDAAGDAFALAAANLIAADMTLGPIVGPILGALAVGVIKGLKSETKSLLGFSSGGLGLVGEKGVPEIIGPTKDFSQFASQLVTQTVKGTVQALGNDSGGATGSGGRRSIRHKVEFSPLRATGRDLETSTIREGIAKKTELLLS